MGLLLKPSAWIVRWSHLLTPGADVLDVACGSGRHLAWFSGQGHLVTGVDRDVELARQTNPDAELVCADIEDGSWPFQVNGRPRQFGAVVVTNYLWRPLLPTLINSVAPGGVLLYETFVVGNEVFGRPSRPDFLLQPGELLSVCTDLSVVAYECGRLADPPRCMQRVAAVRLAGAADQQLVLDRCSL
jgi:SAM-dependent methyltransferase